MPIIKPMRIVKGEDGRIRKWMEKRVKRRIEKFKKRVGFRQDNIEMTSAYDRVKIHSKPYRDTLDTLKLRAPKQELAGWFVKRFHDEDTARTWADDPPFAVSDIKDPEYETDTNMWAVRYKKGLGLGAGDDYRKRAAIQNVKSALARARATASVHDTMDVAYAVEQIDGFLPAPEYSLLHELAAHLIEATLQNDGGLVKNITGEMSAIIEGHEGDAEVYAWEIYDPRTGKVLIDGFGRSVGRETLSSYRYNYGSHLEIREKNTGAPGGGARPLAGIPDLGVVPAFDAWVKSMAESTGETIEKIRAGRAARNYSKMMGWANK